MLEPVDRAIEAQLLDRIDPERMDEHLDAFEGLKRHSGTEDEWTASEYVVDTLAESGVEAELLEYEAYISEPVDAVVEVTAPTQRTIDEAITTAFSAATPPSGVHGEVVRVEDLESLEPGSLAGKIAFATGLPRPEMVLAAEAAEAEAMIVESVTEGQLHEMIVTPIWGTPSVDDVDQLPDLPVAEITTVDAAWLRDRCEQGPVEASVTTEVTTELATLPCPVGYLPGTDSDRYMVVGNHVDSWYEGLTDNATAMAATLEMARVFAEDRPKRGLLFGFWSAHSFGRFAGSSWYADTHWIDLRENGVAYLHLDLNGLRGADSLWYQHMAELEAEQLDVLETVSELPLDPDGEKAEDVPMWEGSDRPGRAADQSFWGAGLCSLFSGIRLEAGTQEGGPIGGGWWWHTPEDTRDKVDLDVLRQETELYVALASRICNSPVLPHDYAATVADFETALDQIEAAAEGAVSFEDEREAIARASAAVADANAVIDEQAADDPAVAAAAEDLQVSLGNELVPALYMERQDYEHEPAFSHRLLPYLRVAEELPSLTGRDRRFAETKIGRGRSKLVHRLDRAADKAASFVDAYGQ